MPTDKSFEPTDYGRRDCEWEIHSLLQNKKDFDLQVGPQTIPRMDKEKTGEPPAPRENDFFLMRDE
jgi:hypothetical protein